MADCVLVLSNKDPDGLYDADLHGPEGELLDIYTAVSLGEAESIAKRAGAEIKVQHDAFDDEDWDLVDSEVALKLSDQALKAIWHASHHEDFGKEIRTMIERHTPSTRVHNWKQSA